MPRLLAPRLLADVHIGCTDDFVLGLDVGNVMSRRCNDRDGKDQDIWRYADPGCYAFLLLFAVVYGAHRVVVCSRINGQRQWWSGSDYRECWVLRFLRDGMGFGSVFDVDLDEQVQIVNDFEEKGEALSNWRPTIFIDDHIECLASIFAHPLAAYNFTPILYNNMRGRVADVPGCAREHYPEASSAVLRMRDWHDLALGLNLPRADEIFLEKSLQHFPPYKPPSTKDTMWVCQRLTPGLVRQPPGLVRQPPMPSTSSSTAKAKPTTSTPSQAASASSARGFTSEAVSADVSDASDFESTPPEAVPAESALASSHGSELRALVQDTLTAGKSVSVVFKSDGSTEFRASPPQRRSRWTAEAGNGRGKHETQWHLKKRLRAEAHHAAKKTTRGKCD